MTGGSVAQQVLGYAGGAFLTVVLVPQVVKTWRERTDHASALFLIFEILASGCFICYGVLLPGHDGFPVILSNASALMCTLALVGAKLKFRKSNNTASEPSTTNTSNPSYGALA